jgi:hypothetical protein
MYQGTTSQLTDKGQWSSTKRQGMTLVMPEKQKKKLGLQPLRSAFRVIPMETGLFPKLFTRANPIHKFFRNQSTRRSRD